MASIDQTQNASFDIEWARGDNDPKLFRIKSGGSVVDISEWVLRMAVNSELNPADGQKQIFSVQGQFVTDGKDGEVYFTPPAGSLDSIPAPVIVYYDISRVSPSKKTLLKGKVNIIMDIDKS
ncbi:MAG: hypothetical protein JKP98_12555 [Rhodobacteraceae bacterium]|jgi:hypothetical protein|nr:hypothetical protein [Alphaproteobacteria bacterium]MBL4557612.1 hypothetical protein [Paracoccaceae bacterium]